MKKRLVFIFLLFCAAALSSEAARLHGFVTDEHSKALPFASILIKGTTRGTTANNEGSYSLDLEPGEYTIVCQYVGYARQEKKIRVPPDSVSAQAQPARIQPGQTVAARAMSAPALTLDFQLFPQQLSMAEVVVRPGGEDPAYDIIRHAIKKRKDYENPLDSFTCEAYIKTLVKTRGLPKRLLGQKIDDKDKREMGVDSSGRGIILLSESLTRIAFRKPGKIRLEVLSGRQSGSDGYGFNFPTFINFYHNNVSVLTTRLNPRGFVSPIAESALSYYRYKYLGSFQEDGKEINTIRVIPKRTFEPLFSGTIDIVDGEWRIHSLDLRLVKESQLEILDTLEIRQIHMPIGKNGVWQTKDQSVYFTFNIFGVDAVGSFLNVYNKYDPAPVFRKKLFGSTIVKYDTSVNKKGVAYWDSIRPVPLEPEELSDYRVKDSVFLSGQDSAHSRRNRDSLLTKQGPVRPWQLITGFRRSDFNPAGALDYSLQPLIRHVQYNTVEGLNLDFVETLTKHYKARGAELSLSPHIRYGFSNGHLNAWATLAWNKRSVNRNGEGLTRTRLNWSLSGGKRVSQFNNADPIGETLNSLYTLFWRRNYMKVYEDWFGELRSSRRFDNGLQASGYLRYEDRWPLANTTGYSILHPKDREFTRNYPVEQLNGPFVRHQAFLTGIDLQYQPGQRYIEFPDSKVSIGSPYPVFYLSWQKGWEGFLGSDVNFDKWSFSLKDDANFKLLGRLSYRLGIGGFLQARKVFIQDYQHFNGNQLLFASEYLNSFQLAPYYANSTTASFYATGHLEHHFNGLLTNKIPLFRRLNWFLVGGSNAFYVSRDNHYLEVFGGLENIFKVLRVDLVGSWLNGGANRQFGVRVGFGGILGNTARRAASSR